jgi:hypothetical protein
MPRIYKPPSVLGIVLNQGGHNLALTATINHQDDTASVDVYYGWMALRLVDAKIAELSSSVRESVGSTRTLVGSAPSIY